MSRKIGPILCCVAVLTCVATVSGAAASIAGEPDFPEHQRSHWAFQPVAEPDMPAFDTNHPIDAFVLARLRGEGIRPAARADRTALIRRATFDLHGLPPTPAEVQAFVEDDSPDAFAKVVDRLLASPRYGERWARHWLDLARYAESEGFKSDETRPNAWRYRDYVIESLNSDKPYDRFVQEQIAGDELWPNDPKARIATGFNRHYADESNAAILMQRRQEVLLDITDTVGSVFLGLTYSCAKCHDHKFDPILQSDYYRLQAFFTNVATDDEIHLLTEQQRSERKLQQAKWEEATHDIRAQMDGLLEAKRADAFETQVNRRSPETQQAFRKNAGNRSMYERLLFQQHMWQMRYHNDARLANSLPDEDKERYRELEAALAEFDHVKPAPLPVGMGIRELGPESPATHVLSFANYAAPLEEVEPGYLTLLAPGPAAYAPALDGRSSGRRTALAGWLTGADNPLTARVMANRLWHYHFGQGIVRTPSDFGLMGEPPTHPELLDWLAVEFRRSGWSIKQMHRLIMNSQTYQQSSEFRQAASEEDPLNRLLWRFPPQRLEGEVIRDSMLAVAGRLNHQVGGPSVFPKLPVGASQPRGGWDVPESRHAQDRRSVYVFVRRNSRYPMLESFDMPDTHESCARRSLTTTAPQALALLNSEHTLGWAQGLAGRILDAAGADRDRQIQAGFGLTYSRQPDGWEKDTVLTFFETQRAIIAERAAAGEPLLLPDVLPAGMSQQEAAAVVDFAHMLLNSNEFVFKN
ncbi:MAG: DUF1553 domain-containing protein [Acidobacteriia bacterium]|nr:DUF1553 domain-containing protein [Terriglobia bacterium]MYG04394.1 DUF1553 domain-containing protein [Terriglobia bacterium]